MKTLVELAQSRGSMATTTEDAKHFLLRLHAIYGDIGGLCPDELRRCKKKK